MKDRYLKLKNSRNYNGKIFDSNNNIIPINGSMEGMSAFLICGGPSFIDILNKKLKINDKIYTGKEALNLPGFITMAVNNSVKTFRPNLWCSSDSPANFMKSIWLDPKIQKFTPTGKKFDTIWNNGPPEWEMTNIKTSSCPNVYYYGIQSKFDKDTFLTNPFFSWGSEAKVKCSEGVDGKRSVMLPAIRILYELGIKNVYLLGCDFSMSENNTYHFDQSRHDGSINGNTATYKALNIRFDAIKDQLIENDFNVFNCNPESNLKSFPFKDFAECLNEAIKFMPDIENERTEGMYDRKRNERLLEESMEEYIKQDVEYSLENYKEYTPTSFEYENGILYCNNDIIYLPRLLTSIHSLRKVYNGSICILSVGEHSNYICKKICEKYNCKMISVQSECKKSDLHNITPFNNTIYIDIDTIVLNDISYIFNLIKTNEFIGVNSLNIRFRFSRDLRMWKKIIPNLIDKNKNIRSVDPCVFGFSKDSLFMYKWNELTNKAIKELKDSCSSSYSILCDIFDIPLIDDVIYNDKDNFNECSILTFPKNKHCLGNLHDLNPKNWLTYWNEIYRNNICDVKDWYRRTKDKKLMKILKG